MLGLRFYQLGLWLPDFQNCLCTLFGSTLPISCSPTLRGPGHVRPWLSTVRFFSGSCFSVVPSLGFGTTPTDPAPLLVPSGLHTQVLFLVPSQLPGTSSLIPTSSSATSLCWAVSGLSFFPWGSSDRQGRAIITVMGKGSPSPGKNPSSGEDFLGQAQGLHDLEPELQVHRCLFSGKGGGLAAFPWFSWPGLAFGFPSQLTVSKQYKMC